MLSFRLTRSDRTASRKNLQQANPELVQPATSPRSREAPGLASARDKWAAVLPGQTERGEKVNMVALMTEGSKLKTQVSELQAEIERLKAAAAEGAAPQPPPPSASTERSVAPDILKAAEKGDLDAVKAALAARSADKDATNRFGRTPLIEAARNGHLNIIELLLEAGADVTVRNKFGQSAADFALEKGHLMTYARLDPVGAMAQSKALRRQFAEATTVHLLSTRSRKDPTQFDRRARARLGPRRRGWRTTRHS